jgi:hypothetical protein
MNLGGATDQPCPTFISGCCRCDLESPKFRTTGVDCTANNPLQQMDAFVRAWGGAYADPESHGLFNQPQTHRPPFDHREQRARARHGGVWQFGSEH